VQIVSGLAVLAEVEALFFVFFLYPQAYRRLIETGPPGLLDFMLWLPFPFWIEIT
jgi:hypothetical protein